jgi:hypothetical protein
MDIYRNTLLDMKIGLLITFQSRIDACRTGSLIIILSVYFIEKFISRFIILEIGLHIIHQ